MDTSRNSLWQKSAQVWSAKKRVYTLCKRCEKYASRSIYISARTMLPIYKKVHDVFERGSKASRFEAKVGFIGVSI